MGNARVGTHTDRHAHALTTRQQKEKRVNGKIFRRQCREEILKPPDVRSCFVYGCVYVFARVYVSYHCAKRITQPNPLFN